MPFFKGDERINTKGRPKGSGNKSAEQFRDLIRKFLSENWPNVQADFEGLKASERIAFIDKMLRYVVPEPLSPAKLTEDQLSQLAEYMTKLYGNEQNK